MVLSLQKNYFIAFIIIHCYNNLLMKKNYTVKSVHHTFIFLILLGLLSNALAMSLPPLQVSVDTNKINSYAEYTIIFDRSQITSPDTNSPYMSQLIPSNTNITVIFPPEIDTILNTSPSCNASPLTCGTCTFSGNLLTVQNCFLSTNNVTSVILKIWKIKNPWSPLTTSQFSGAIGSQIASSGSNITFICITPCQTCVNFSYCLTCVCGYSFLGTNSGICLPSCPSGYISIVNICTACVSPCATCSGTLYNCTSCIFSASQPLFFSPINTCVSANGCPSTYYANSINYQCVSCVSPCVTCSSQTMCLTCMTNYQLSGTTCISISSPCPLGQIPINLVCTNCDPICYTCSNSLTNCTSCDPSNTPNRYLSATACVEVCPSYTYADLASMICKLCVSPCQTCSSFINCLTCVPGYFLSAINSGICLSYCPSGYLIIVNICTACVSPCLTCSGTLYTCTSCIPSIVSPVFLTNSNTCVSANSCPSTYYANSINYQCVPCVSPCATCSSQIICYSCLSGFQLSGTTCISISFPCPIGQIPINLVCTNCDPACFTCFNSLTNCTSCDPSNTPSRYLSATACVEVCPSYTYADLASMICKLCVSPCQTCSSFINCLTCLTSYSMSAPNSGICLPSCPSGYLSIVNICTACVSPCLTCSGTLYTCTSCIPSIVSPVFLTNQNTCVSANGCPSTYYANSINYQCVSCVSPCVTCSSQTMCLTCMTNYQLSGTTCISISSPCPLGQIPINLVCTNCDPACFTCSNSLTNCTSCDPSNTPSRYLSATACVEVCPSYTYADLASMICKLCVSPCQTCSSFINCLTCLTSYSMSAPNSGICLPSCPSGYLSIVNICTACVSPCATCSGTLYNCTSCIFSASQPLFFSPINTCVSANDCPSAYYANSINYECVSCVSPCQTCTSQTMCLSCVMNYQLSGTTCISISSPCPLGQIPINLVCTNCDPACFTCSNSLTNCTSCEPSTNLYLSGSTCVSICPSYTYADATSTICKSCIAPCQTCSSLTVCLTCVAGFSLEINSGICSASTLTCAAPCATCSGTLYTCTSCIPSITSPVFLTSQNTCVPSSGCPSTYYGNMTNYQCVPCALPCVTCLNSIMCLTCMMNYQLSGTTCISISSPCPLGQIPINLVCTNCDPACYTCSYSLTNCTLCDPSNTPNLYLSGNACVSICPSYTYADATSTQCKLCISPCQTCSSLSNCLTCVAGYILSAINSGICLSYCPAGYLSVAFICTACVSPCATCSGTLSDCTSCIFSANSPLFFCPTNNTCVSSTGCPSPYYANSTNYQCVPCVSPCATCLSQTMCLTCIIEYQLSGTTCISISSPCPLGQIPINLVCTNCDPACFTCSNSLTNCTSCDPSNTPNLYLSGNACVSICPSYTYADATSTTCKQCVSPCQTCSSLSNCLTCVAGYILSAINSGICLSYCPAGYLSVAFICTACVSPCATCSGTLSDCTSCIFSANSPLFFCPTNNTCVSSTGCPSPYYANSTNYQCVPCVSPCATCLSQTMCLTCISGYQLSGTSCILIGSSCPIGQILINSICQSCTSPCATCSSSLTYCTSCLSTLIPPVFLTGNSCVTQTQCPLGYYANFTNNLCTQCISSCSQCNDSNICLLCNTGYSLQSATNTCVTSCLYNQISINSICTTCSSPCLTCAYSTMNCTSCQSNLSPAVFLYLYSCVSICPDYTYPNITTNQCQPCVSPCATCTTSSLCLSCLTGYALYSNTCLSTCPQGTTSVNQVCMNCSSSCLTCINTTTICLSCALGYYLVPSSYACVSSCPANLFVNSLTQTCVGCDDACSTCSNYPTNCTACNTGILYNLSPNFTCVENCPAQYYNLTNICTACPTGCVTCTSSASCQSCISGYYLYIESCLLSCPATTQIIVNDICKNCSTANCQNCTPNDYCYKCYSPYYILNGTCYSTCPPSFVAQSQTCYFQPETTYSVYPMPFSIATVIIIILCFLLRYNDINFFASGAIYSITSIPETLVNLYFVYLYYIYTNQNFKDRLFLCIVCSFAWLFLINILLFIVFYVHYLNDKAFKKWLKQRSKITYSLVIILSLFVNHKVINLIFSRMLRFEIFSARLENIKKFFWIHFMWFLSSIHTISGIGLCSYNLYINGSIRDQLYFESIDLMVVLILNSIFGILNLYIDQDYFKHKNLINEQDAGDSERINSEQIFIYDKVSKSYKPMNMNDLNNCSNQQVFIYDKNSKQYRLINSSDLNSGGQFVVNFKSFKPMNINNLNKSQFTNSATQNIFAYDRQSKSYKLLNVTDLNSSQSELVYVYDRNSNSYRPTMMSQDKLNEQSINSPTHKMDDSPSKINKNTIMNINQIDQVEDQQYPSNVEKQIDKNKKNPRKKGLLKVKVDEREDEQIDQVQLQQNKQKQLVEQANTRLKNKKRNMKQKNKKMTNYYYQQQNQSKVDPSLLKIKKTSEEQPIILAKIRPVDNPVQLDQQKKVEKNPYLEQLIDFNQQEQNLEKSPEEGNIKQNPSTIQKRSARKQSRKPIQQKYNPNDYLKSSKNPNKKKQQSQKKQQRLASQKEKNLLKK